MNNLLKLSRISLTKSSIFPTSDKVVSIPRAKYLHVSSHITSYWMLDCVFSLAQTLQPISKSWKVVFGQTTGLPSQPGVSVDVYLFRHLTEMAHLLCSIIIIRAEIACRRSSFKFHQASTSPLSHSVGWCVGLGRDSQKKLTRTIKSKFRQRWLLRHRPPGSITYDRGGSCSPYVGDTLLI